MRFAAGAATVEEHVSSRLRPARPRARRTRIRGCRCAKAQVFVWLARFDSPDAHARAIARLSRSAQWRALEPPLARQLKSPTQTLRLQWTARSLLR